MDSPPSLKTLRLALLRLHKTLLDWERAAYERVHGRQSSNALLEALLKDPQFAWLRPISQLVVRIDEMLEDEVPPGENDVEVVLAHVRDLTARTRRAMPTSSAISRRFRTTQTPCSPTGTWWRC